MISTSPQPQRTDVVVVGAGPSGLLLAAELALGGVAVRVLERRAEPDLTVKAGSISVATAEILDRRGLLPAAEAAQTAFAQEVMAFRRTRPTDPVANTGPAQRAAVSLKQPGFPATGHFAAMFFRPDLIDQSDPRLRAHTAVAGGTLVPQRAMESLLADHAARAGVGVERGVEVTGLDQRDDTVTLETTAGPIVASWVVGADGGRSGIRKLSGIDFPGTPAETTGYQAIADLEGAEALRPGWTWGPTGVYCIGPIPGRVLTVQFTGPPADRDAPVTAQEIQDSLRLVSGVDVTVTALHGRATRWTDNARQASTYRSGRVLLVGDAAHVHSPFSGQGLNLGVGDAVNLGWKLAATIKGWAPDGLLDTYHAERHAIGAWVLDWTRAQVALMRGDAKTALLRDVVSRDLLGTTESMTRVAALTSGIAQRYTLNSSSTAAGVDFGPRPNGENLGAADVLGRLVGDIALRDGSRLADHAHDGGFVLLDRTSDHVFARTATRWATRVTTVTDEPVAATGVVPVGLLVRPDGVVCWATDDSEPEGLEPALRRWAGQPAAMT